MTRCKHCAKEIVKGVVYLLVVLNISCGIFQPRDTFELPVVTVAVDRFNFTSIFDSIQRPFVWKDYDIFFSDTFKFLDSRSSGDIYGKTKFIACLQQLTLRHKNLKVSWSEVAKPIDEDGKRLTINELKYAFTLDTTAVEKEVVTGKSRMVILWDGTYKVIIWDDFPELRDKSIFTPE